jgi:Ca-activated chloride channel family protein
LTETAGCPPQRIQSRSPRRTSGGAFCLALVAVLAAIPARAQVRPTQRPPQRGQLKVRVDLVSVLTSVLDASGKPVTDLPRQDFHLYQDGKEQQIELFERQTNMPLDLVLMIDTSLSAVGDLKFEIEAAQHFIHQVLRPGDQLAVFTFAYDVTQLSPFTGRLDSLDAALKRVRPGTGTSLFDAVYLGSHSLDQLPPDRRRVLLLVTDAGETTSRTGYDGARDAAIRAGAMLYTILIRVVKSESGRNTAGEHAIDTIIDATGGAMYPVDLPNQFGPTFDRINEELRTEYLLGFYPKPEPPPGSHHTIVVRLGTPGPPGAPYVLRFRKEYFTPGTSQ